MYLPGHMRLMGNMNPLPIHYRAANAVRWWLATPSPLRSKLAARARVLALVAVVLVVVGLVGEFRGADDMVRVYEVR